MNYMVSGAYLQAAGNRIKELINSETAIDTHQFAKYIYQHVNLLRKIRE